MLVCRGFGKCVPEEREGDGEIMHLLVKRNRISTSYISDATCTTLKRNKCKFPYHTGDGQLRYECFKRKTTSISDPVQFKSYCPTKVDPITRIMDEDSIEECFSLSCPLAKYHTHGELMNDLNEIFLEFSDNAETFDLGKSQLGNMLYGIRLMKGVFNINKSVIWLKFVVITSTESKTYHIPG